MVTRVFVLLLPVFLFGAAYSISRGQPAVAMLAAGTLFLFFCSQSYLIYVGRSDATALCLFAVAGALAHRLLVTRHRNWANRSYVAAQVGLGATSAAVFLTCWRYAPVLALQFVVLVPQVYDSNRHLRPFGRPVRGFVVRVFRAAKNVGLSMALFVAGVAAVFLPIHFFELHGMFRTFYRHFVGFFVADNSGWGLYPGGTFRIIPEGFVHADLGIVHLCGVLILIGLYRLRRRPLELLAWLLMLAASWTAISYAFWKNYGGGGAHYFYQFFIFAWIFILHASCRRDRSAVLSQLFYRRNRWGALYQVVLVGVIAFLLPWKQLIDQRKTLSDARTRARAFRTEVERLTKGQPIFGEEVHLFKRTYRGEVVDMGDVCAAIARSGYFGEAFTQTFNDYARKLATNPPKFVIGSQLDGDATPGRIMSQALQDVLRSRYTIRARAQSVTFATGSSLALFERND